VTVPAFIGDEVTAAAWRLIGVRAEAIDEDGVEDVFEAMLGETKLLLVTAPCAAELDSELLDVAVRAAKPLILVVPDAANRVALPDLDRQVDRVLGIEQ
jgi:vacuolar-type H+-ATPase subunit F/Vma7